MSVAPRLLALGCAWLVAGCSLGGAVVSPAPGESLGPVTPPPSPGEFRCPIQRLADEPPTSRLVNVEVVHGADYDTVVFSFAPGEPPDYAEDSGLIVRQVGVPPTETGDGDPLNLTGEEFIEVRFRDMRVTSPDGSASFTGATDIRPRQGAIRDVVALHLEERVIDWLIGTTSPGCARMWVDEVALQLRLDVQR